VHRDRWSPRLVALDIDGTILRGDQPVSNRVRATIRNAIAAGAHVVLATGRPVIGTRPVLVELELAGGDVLCSNGAVRMDAATGAFRDVHRFHAGQVVDRLRSLLPGVIFAVEQLGAGNLVTGQFPGAPDALERLVDHVRLVAEPVTRLTAWWGEHTATELAAAVGVAGLSGVQWFLDDHEPWLVAGPEGISKAVALERVRLDLGVPADATLAVGDGTNDVEMLRWAAHGVAMGQAPDSVKAAAHEVTGTVDEDGLATVLERWFG
jgi:hydroxymethylpyrimidine pyrophosphatase-like HAD family hydrolase